MTQHWTWLLTALLPICVVLGGYLLYMLASFVGALTESPWIWLKTNFWKCLVAFMAFGLAWNVFWNEFAKAHDVYKSAVRIVTTDAALIENIGTPVTPTYLVGGASSISPRSDGSKKTVIFDVFGPRGRARIVVAAIIAPKLDNWELKTISAETNEGLKLELLHPGN